MQSQVEVSNKAHIMASTKILTKLLPAKRASNPIMDPIFPIKLNKAGNPMTKLKMALPRVGFFLLAMNEYHPWF